MKSMIKSILVVGIAVLAAVSMAQGGGGGGRGQGRGGMRGFQDASGVFLLQRPEVQVELKLTDDQKSKLAAIRDEQGQKMREAFQNFQSMSQEERTAAGQKM